jgi:flagellar basal body-associated protein FliL
MRRNTINIIILTLTVINLVLNVLIIFSVVPNANKTNELINKIVKLVDLDISDIYAENQSSVTIDDLEMVAITSGSGDDASGKLTINLKSTDGKTHYAVVNAYITLDTTNESYASKSGSITNAMPLITDIVTSVISQYDSEAAKDPTVQEEMKQAILSQVQQLFQSNMIYSVIFESFIVK